MPVSFPEVSRRIRLARTARSSSLENRTAREKLKKLDEAHWQRVGPGVHLGYARRSGNWRARVLVAGTRRYAKTTLGPADDHVEADGERVLTYFHAAKAALAWADRERLAKTAPLTVREACRRYVAHLRAEGRTSADDAEGRLNKHVGAELGDKLLAALTLDDLQRWRDGLVAKPNREDPDAVRRSRDTANRLLNYLKAALNLAIRDPANKITDDRAWRFLSRFENVGAQREAILDLEQARLLIAKAPNEATARLIRAGLLTGCRYGELRMLKAGDFDPRSGTLTIRQGKTGRRPVVLDSRGIAFFRDQAKDKLPGAWLLTGPRGDQWGFNHQLRPFTAARKAAKLDPAVCFYTLRHTHISHAIMAGRSLQLLAENCGTSVRMIEKNYAKWLANQRAAEIERTALAL